MSKKDNSALIADVRAAAIRSRVYGRGASGSGHRHWIAQRSTALVLLGTVVWFVAELVMHQPDTLDAARAWLSMPHAAVLLALLIGAGAWHLHIGIASIAADYLQADGLRIALLFAARLALIALTLAVWGALVVIVIMHGGAA